MAIGEHEQLLAERLKAALETLEAISRDRTLLHELTVEERTRLLSPAGYVLRPHRVTPPRAARWWSARAGSRGDAGRACAKEAAFAGGGARREFLGLALLPPLSAEDFSPPLRTPRDRLDFIISNACQTVRRPPEFYRHMME